MQVSVGTSVWTGSWPGCSGLIVLVLLLPRTIYEKLACAFTEEVAVLYRQRVEEISPNIRYCAYNIGEYRAGSVGRAGFWRRCSSSVSDPVAFCLQGTRTPSMT